MKRIIFFKKKLVLSVIPKRIQSIFLILLYVYCKNCHIIPTVFELVFIVVAILFFPHNSQLMNEAE